MSTEAPGEPKPSVNMTEEAKAGEHLDYKLQTLLRELTLLVSGDQAPNRDRLFERIKALRTNVAEVIEMRKRKFTTPLEARRKMLHGKMRLAVTGSSDRSVRAFVQEKRRQPSIVRFLDKVSFLLGVLLITGSEYVLLVMPHSFWMLYAVVLPLLLTGRVVYYRSKKWEYFLYDFCYAVQMMCFIYLLALPDSALLLKMLFLYANGPLAWAIAAWRNSLVFHDFEKLTSVFIHMYPPWLLFTLRWYPLSAQLDSGGAQLSTVSVREFGLAFAVYAVWQALYYVKLEWIDKAKLDADPSYVTSLRYLSESKGSGVNIMALKLCRKLHLFAKEEQFVSSSPKTKAVFIAFQAMFVVSTMLMSVVLLRSFALNLLFIVAIFSVAVWNGGDYYIEVFSRRYIAGIEGRAASLSPHNKGSAGSAGLRDLGRGDRALSDGEGIIVNSTVAGPLLVRFEGAADANGGANGVVAVNGEGEGSDNSPLCAAEPDKKNV